MHSGRRQADLPILKCIWFFCKRLQIARIWDCPWYYPKSYITARLKTVHLIRQALHRSPWLWGVRLMLVRAIWKFMTSLETRTRGRVSQDECSIKGTGTEYRKNVGSPREHWLQANWEAHGSWGEYGKTKSSWEKTKQKRKGSSGHEPKSCSSHFTLLRGNMLCYLVEAIHQSLLRNTNNTKRTCDRKFTRTALRAQKKTRKQKSVFL